MNEDNQMCDCSCNSDITSFTKCGCSTDPKLDISRANCPKCGKRARLVKNQTVRFLLKPEIAKEVKKNNSGKEDYHLCMDKLCDVSYFKENIVYNVYDMNEPIWFKKNANPKWACYCNKVTEQDVIKAVEDGLTDMAAIIERVNGKMVSQCQVKNPLGLCCTQAFNEMIENAISKKG